MRLGNLPAYGRKMAQKSYLIQGALALLGNCAKLGEVVGFLLQVQPTRYPSPFRGPLAFGSAPVFLSGLQPVPLTSRIAGPTQRGRPANLRVPAGRRSI